MDIPQPWLPPPALPAGPAAAGCRPELRSQNQSLLSATRLCQLATLALALMTAVAPLDAPMTEGARCGAHLRACRFICSLQRSPHPPSRGLQSPQKQHQVCRDGRLEAGSTPCLSEKTTAWAGSPYRMDSLQKQDLRRPKIHGAVEVSRYQPPTLASLQRLLWVRRTTTLTHINEVWPNLFLGDAPRAGSLRHGGKPLCHSCPGLPHDLREHDSGRCHPDGAGPPRYLPQLRLSPTAPGFGQQAEAGIRTTLI